LGKKYPKDLANLYRDLLEKRPGMESWPLAVEIVRSALPREEKLELLKVGGRHENLDHRYSALWSLQEFDEEAGVALLARALDELPASPQGMYRSCREASFGLLVRRSADARVWKALASAARRADAGLRLELIAMVSWEGTEGAIRKEQLAFLSGFLSDETIRVVVDSPAKLDNCTASRFPRIEVRNYAGMRLATILDIEEVPEPEWTSEKWETFRDRVKKLIAEKQ
jgi:hypothetical protein